MPAKMNIQQRMMAVYRNQMPDQIPIGIYNRYLPRGFSGRELRNMGLGIIDYHPIVSLLAPPWHTYEGFISQVKGAEFNITFSWQAGHRLEHRTYKTKVGSISQITRKDPAYGSDWINKHYISSIDDYKILQYITENTIFRKNEKEFLSKVDNLGEDGVVLGRLDRCPFQKMLIELAGPEQFLVDLQTNPKPVEELLEVMDRKLNEAFEMAMDFPAEIIWQPDNVTADMTPPKYFAKYCRPFYEKHGSRFRQVGKRYVIHMDGKLKAIKELIAKSPFDVVESMSLPIIGGDMTFAEAREAWPNKVILPNFPASLCTETKETIETFLGRLLEEVATETAFMLQISEDIPADQWKRVLPILCSFFQK